MSLFVASPEIQGRNGVEADNWARHKKTFYSEKKIEHKLHKGPIFDRLKIKLFFRDLL
jgi:hypothetical protein